VVWCGVVYSWFVWLTMSAKRQVVLVGCGSFNPVTNMHLRMFGKCDSVMTTLMIGGFLRS